MTLFFNASPLIVLSKSGLLSDYRTRLTAIRSTVASESRILRAAIKWGKGLV